MKVRSAAAAGSLAVLCAVAAASFGGSASAATSATCAHPKNTKVMVDMYEMGFTVKPAVIPCGKVTFMEKNTGAIQHNFHVEGFKAGKLLPAGTTFTQVLTLKPGRYSYQCDVLGHAQAGMTGGFKVK